MKKLFFLAFALLAIGFTSCETDPQNTDSQTDVIETDDYTKMLLGTWVVVEEFSASSRIVITDDPNGVGFYCSMVFFEENENKNKVNIIQKNNGEGVGPEKGIIQARLWYVEDEILYIEKTVNKEQVFYGMEINYINDCGSYYELKMQYSEDIRGVGEAQDRSGGHTILQKPKK